MPSAKVARELLAHLGERAIAMRLEHDQQPAGLGGQGCQRRGDLVGIVREIVDDGHAAGRADRLEPALQACEPCERRHGIAERKCPARGPRRARPARSWHCGGRARQLDIVPVARQARP